MTNKKLVIIGTGETANLAYEYFTHDSDYEVAAFSVSKDYLKEKSFKDLPVVEFETVEKVYSPDEYYAFVAMAGEKLNRNRTRMYLATKNKGYKMASYVSSRAFVWHNTQIGENCFILEDNTLQPFTKVGNNVVMWSGNHLGHQSEIKDNCFITSHCVICGQTVIGENSYLGVNSSVADFVTVAKDNFIAMGAVVNKKTKEDGLYIGNPAKRQVLTAKEYCGVTEE